MRLDHAALVEQREAARGFQHALDHEHHVRPAASYSSKQSATFMLIGPGRMPSRNSVT